MEKEIIHIESIVPLITDADYELKRDDIYKFVSDLQEIVCKIYETRDSLISFEQITVDNVNLNVLIIVLRSLYPFYPLCSDVSRMYDIAIEKCIRANINPHRMLSGLIKKNVLPISTVCPMVADVNAPDDVDAISQTVDALLDSYSNYRNIISFSNLKPNEVSVSHLIAAIRTSYKFEFFRRDWELAIEVARQACALHGVDANDELHGLI